MSGKYLRDYLLGTFKPRVLGFRSKRDDAILHLKRPRSLPTLDYSSRTQFYFILARFVYLSFFFYKFILETFSSRQF